MKDAVKNIVIVILSAIWLAIFVCVGAMLNVKAGWAFLVAWLVIFILYILMEYVCVHRFKCSKIPYLAFTIILAFPMMMFMTSFFCVLMNYTEKTEATLYATKAIMMYAAFIPARVMLVPVEILIKKLKG